MLIFDRDWVLLSTGLVVTISIPLYDQAGKLWGVAGVDVSRSLSPHPAPFCIAMGSEHQHCVICRPAPSGRRTDHRKPKKSDHLQNSEAVQPLFISEWCQLLRPFRVFGCPAPSGCCLEHARKTKDLTLSARLPRDFCCSDLDGRPRPPRQRDAVWDARLQLPDGHVEGVRPLPPTRPFL